MNTDTLRKDNNINNPYADMYNSLGVIPMKAILCSYSQISFLVVLLCHLLSIPSLINASQKKHDNQKVLIVNSYHPGYTWSDDIMLGVRDGLAAQQNIELIFEHLDTKRHFEKQYFRQLEELFRQKYRYANIDIIITSDDNALDFILGIRKELFPDIPLIFCGIDHISPERIAGYGPIYGIEEADSTASTIDLILSIHPDIESITFVADETSTGRLMIDEVRKLGPSIQKRVRFSYMVGGSVEELQAALKKLPDNTIIFYLSFIRDKNGKVFSITNSMRFIAENSKVPVYCSWGFQQDTGIIGGNILSGYKQGEISANVARKLLSNEPIERIPAIQQAPLVYKFDHKVMERFNIDQHHIPENSIIYNRPFSFYETYKTLIVITIFIVLCLLLFILLLSLNIARRKKAEIGLQEAHDSLNLKVKIRTAELTKSNELLEAEVKERKQTEGSLQSKEVFLNRIIDQSPFAIWISDAEGTMQRANPALKKFLNLTDEQLIGKYNVLQDVLAIRQGLLPLFRTVFDEGKTINFTCDWDGNDIPTMELKGSNSVSIEATMFPIFNPEGELTNVVLNWIDITDRKQAEDQIKASLKEKETLLYEIHHRVKNNMNVVSSLIKLQENSVEDERIKEVLKESQGRIYAMSAVHEFLYNTSNLAEIDLKSYLSKISGKLIQTYSINPSQVRFNIEGDRIILSVEKASPVGLVINELVSNSLKYAFPKNKQGAINVNLKKLDKQLELIVMDNGIGMPDSVDWKNTGTLGLKLIRALVENQLDGSIDMDTKNGTRFTIRFNIET